MQAGGGFRGGSLAVSASLRAPNRGFCLSRKLQAMSKGSPPMTTGAMPSGGGLRLGKRAGFQAFWLRQPGGYVPENQSAICGRLRKRRMESKGWEVPDRRNSLALLGGLSSFLTAAEPLHVPPRE